MMTEEEFTASLVKKVAVMEMQLEVAFNLINAVAHVGVDCGYGKYTLTDKMIAEARSLSESYKKAI